MWTASGVKSDKHSRPGLWRRGVRVGLNGGQPLTVAMVRDRRSYTGIPSSRQVTEADSPKGYYRRRYSTRGANLGVPLSPRPRVRAHPAPARPTSRSRRPPRT